MRYETKFDWQGFVAVLLACIALGLSAASFILSALGH